MWVMADIGQFNKLTNLWPGTPPQRIERSGQGSNANQQKKRQPEKPVSEQHDDDNSGLHIDEYV